MRQSKQIIGFFIAILFALFNLTVKGQPIAPRFYAVNAWMPDTIGNASACVSSPCVLYGKMHKNWQKVQESGMQLVRFGGIAADKNKPTNYQYIKMVDSIRAHGMEPILQVPYYNGYYTAQQAAAIVQYVNVTKSRNVKYWIIGNEPNLTYGYNTASQVAGYIKPFASAMKAIDPTILIIGPEFAGWQKTMTDDLTNPGGTYDITGTDASGRYYIDIFSYHSYPMGNANSVLPTRSDVINKLTASSSYQDQLTYLNGRLNAANQAHGRTGSSAVKAAITEANVDYTNNSNDNVSGVGAMSFLGAQFVAEMYGIGMRQGLSFVTLWSTVEGNNISSNIGYLDGPTSSRKPMYYHLQMMTAGLTGTAVSATDNQPNVKAFATKTSSSTALMIMNQESATDYTFTARLNTSSVTASSALRLNVDAGIPVEYTDAIPYQSTILFTFDLNGNLVKKTVYTMTAQASSSLAPVTYTYGTVDLVAQNAGLSSASVQPGASITASATIFNNGNGIASSSKMGFYLSTDSILSQADTYLGSAAGGTLAGNTGAARSTSLSLSQVAAGQYYVLCKADYASEVSESNENNNVRPVALTVYTVQAGMPDLVISSGAVSASQVQPGGSFSISASIANTGNAYASGSKVGYYLSTDSLFGQGDVLLGTVSGGSLAASANASRPASLSMPSVAAGNYFILAFADHAAEVAESNESNNVKPFAITVYTANSGSPDLVADNASLSGTMSLAGATLSAFTTVRNAGSNTALSSKTGWYLSTDSVYSQGDVLLAQSAGGSLSPASSATRQSSFALPLVAPGSYYVISYADHAAEVSESNENNNFRAVALTVYTVSASAPDLRITSMSLNPQQVQQGGSIAINAVVANTGNAPAGSSHTGFYVSADTLLDSGDQLLGSVQTASISASGTASASFNAALSSSLTGVRYIFAVADHSSSIVEASELNNVTRTQVSIAAQPSAADLVVKTASLSTGVITAGSRITIGATVFNMGQMNASASKTAYYLSADSTLDASDALLGSSSSASMAAGLTATSMINAKLPLKQAGGNYYVIVKADQLNAVTEASELNNTRSLPLLVYDRGGLFTLVTAPTASAAVTATVISPSVMLTSFDVYLSDDNYLDASDISLGKASISDSALTHAYSFALPAGVKAGKKYLLMLESGMSAPDVLFGNTQVVREDAAGISAGDEGTFQLYPNPTVSRINATLPSSGSETQVTVTLYDISGRTEMKQVMTSHDGQLALDLPASLARGMHIIQLRYQGKVVSKSIMLVN